MSSAATVDLANEYWFWGMRCESQLAALEQYLLCFKDDKEACRRFDEIKRENEAAINNR
jgi:hypothetical protein